MIVIGYIAFLFIGLILGLIGGGGSILGVPALVYLFSLGAEEATGYSLFIVGLTSLIGAAAYLRNGEISAEALIQFALASMITVFCMRRYVMPVLPEEFDFAFFQMSKDSCIMLVFSILIFFSSRSMIRKRKPNLSRQVKWDEFARSPFGTPFVLLLGILVGCLTGFVGAGGGFIIVPVLMFFLRLNFKKAIGTSLCIIALNSLIGFAGNLQTLDIQWDFLLKISGISIVGIVLGSQLAGKIPQQKLKPAFGWFTLAVGAFVLVKETILS